MFLCVYQQCWKRLSVTKGCYVCYVSTTMYSIGKLMLINPSYYFFSIYSFFFFILLNDIQKNSHFFFNFSPIYVPLLWHQSGIRFLRLSSIKIALFSEKSRHILAQILVSNGSTAVLKDFSACHKTWRLEWWNFLWTCYFSLFSIYLKVINNNKNKWNNNKVGKI